MEFLTDLWLPILLSAVFVFIASSVLHMVIPIHKSDYRKLSGEDAVLEAMRGQGVQPGTYMFPFCESMKDMASPETTKKFEQGPVGWMTLLPPGPFTMGKSLAQWFVYCIVVSVFAAYIASFALPPATDHAYLVVFRLTGTAAVLAYALGNVPNSIWKGQDWSTTLKFVFDGLVYGLVTAGTFGWLWPGGE